MIIRAATDADTRESLLIYDAARKFMKESGNPDQWKGGYPSVDDIRDGIARGTSYVCEDGGEVVAVFHFEENASDACYEHIYDGAWQNYEPYAAIHRIAVKYHGGGIVNFCFQECYKRFPNIKIDTHKDNLPMQKCLTRAGFKYCGIIHLENGEERIAYQKCALSQGENSRGNCEIKDE